MAGEESLEIRYEEECNNIYALVGSPRINQEEVEALKGIFKLVLVSFSCSEADLRN